LPEGERVTMKTRMLALGLLAMLAASATALSAPAADEILKESKAKAASEGKAIFLIFDAPG
jgi:hypothetical protein